MHYKKHINACFIPKYYFHNLECRDVCLYFDDFFFLPGSAFQNITNMDMEPVMNPTIIMVRSAQVLPKTPCI